MTNEELKRLFQQAQDSPTSEVLIEPEVEPVPQETDDAQVIEQSQQNIVDDPLSQAVSSKNSITTPVKVKPTVTVQSDPLTSKIEGRNIEEGVPEYRVELTPELIKNMPFEYLLHMTRRDVDVLSEEDKTKLVSALGVGQNIPGVSRLLKGKDFVELRKVAKEKRSEFEKQNPDENDAWLTDLYQTFISGNRDSDITSGLKTDKKAALLTSLANSALYGFGDEIASFVDDNEKAKRIKRDVAQSSEETPVLDLAAQILGASATLPVSSVKSAIAAAGLYGAGSSDEETLIGRSKDAAIGAAAGAAGGAFVKWVAAPLGIYSTQVVKRLGNITDESKLTRIGREFLDKISRYSKVSPEKFQQAFAKGEKLDEFLIRQTGEKPSRIANMLNQGMNRSLDALDEFADAATVKATKITKKLDSERLALGKSVQSAWTSQPLERIAPFAKDAANRPGGEKIINRMKSYIKEVVSQDKDFMGLTGHSIGDDITVHFNPKNGFFSVFKKGTDGEKLSNRVIIDQSKLMRENGALMVRDAKDYFDNIISAKFKEETGSKTRDLLEVEFGKSKAILDDATKKYFPEVDKANKAFQEIKIKEEAFSAGQSKKSLEFITDLDDFLAKRDLPKLQPELIKELSKQGEVLSQLGVKINPQPVAVNDPNERVVESIIGSALSKFKSYLANIKIGRWAIEKASGKGLPFEPSKNDLMYSRFAKAALEADDKVVYDILEKIAKRKVKTLKGVDEIVKEVILGSAITEQEIRNPDYSEFGLE